MRYRLNNLISLSRRQYSGRTIVGSGYECTAQITAHAKSVLRHGGLVEALEGVGERLLPARHLQKEVWADNGLPQVCTDGNDG